MSRANSSFNIRAEHPKSVHVDCQMKEIRVKKAARDQLPHLESDRTIELGYKKMANRPEREARQKTLPGYRFQSKNSDVYADQQSCESRHEYSLTTSANLHTKITKVHDGHNVAEARLPQEQRRRVRKNETILLRFLASPVNSKEFPAFLRYLAWRRFVRLVMPEPVSQVGNGGVARDLALRQGARRKNILHGSLTDEQRGRGDKDRQPFGPSFGGRLGGVAPQSFRRRGTPAMLLRRALPATRKSLAHPF